MSLRSNPAPDPGSQPDLRARRAKASLAAAAHRPQARQDASRSPDWLPAQGREAAPGTLRAHPESKWVFRGGS